ncbi:MAG: methylenetetrahydrofolate reductase [NAD(P)H] [Polynucleobacter sp.]|nr:methylenetetrahydrofolate reductase [NAD(P)H] [Polynucleobacter sp.]
MEKKRSKELSIEFFPPKTLEGAEKLRLVKERLVKEVKPSFFSVTFGAGGSTQEGTLRTVESIHQSGQEAAPHLSCVGSSKENIYELLRLYKEMGVRRIVALRGDLPSGMGQYGEFHHANELVAYIRESYGDWFHIEVAAYPEMHPQASSVRADIEHFVTKIQAGANSAITQYFYNTDAYFQYIEDVESRGVKVPIVPGIMPITSSSQLLRFSDSCGAEIPRWLRKRLEGFGDDIASIKAFGLDVVTDLSLQLLAGGAPGLHFYSLNQADPTIAIIKNLD